MAHGVRRARLLAGACLVALLAACGDPADSGEPQASPSLTNTPSLSPSASATLDADHEMELPGPLNGPLVPADILIYAGSTLTDDMIERVKAIKGVFRVEQLSLASVTIHNQLYTIGAVDPASYRRFTLSGKQDDIWERVAGGEMALADNLARQVQDKEGFVRLGADTAPAVHIGALAPQAGNIDMVVNDRWGEDLFAVEGNAMLISTFTRSPQSVRKPLEQIVGKQASIQMLDVVAREGLDPDTVQTAIPTSGTVGDAVGVYRYRLVGGRVVPDSAWVAANIVTDTVPLLGTLTCHRTMMPQLKAALAEVVQRGLGKHVYQTAGCYYPRFIANTTRLSNHAFGMAIDINSVQNQRGTVGQMHPEVVRIFEKWGFAWGGHWSWTDPMHFELARIVSAS
jgi:hypothetical protein